MEPTYKLAIGERVLCGNLNNAKVVAVNGDFTVYTLEHDSVDKKTKEVNGRATTTHEWWDVQPDTERKSLMHLKNDALSSLRDSTREINGVVMMALGSRAMSGVDIPRTDMNPVYQRGIVWTLSQKQAFIRSVFEGKELGRLVFRNLPFGKEYSYEIIDGKQRLTALSEFVCSVFDVDGVYYKDLDNHSRFQFKRRPIPVVETGEISDIQAVRIFVACNDTGVPMSKEHLENVKRMMNL